MTPFLRLAASLALAAACTAALAADRKDTRNVAGFSALALDAPIDVDIVQGEAESLVLEGDEERLADIETVVEDGTLKIRMRARTHPWGHSKVRAHVAAKTLDRLAISGSGDIRAASLHAKDFAVSISGSGDVRIGALAAERLRVAISGSGDVSVAGKVERTDASIAGSGDLKAARLESREAKVSIAGSGDATLWARDSVQVSVLGSGDVGYYGDPSVQKSVMGSGSVKRLGAAPS